MKTRAEALPPIPDHLDYYTGEVGGIGLIPIVPMTMADLSEWGKEEARYLAQVEQRSINVIDTLGHKWGLAGAVVGLGWRHATLTLETDRTAFGSLREYGLAVIAELEAAGVPGPQIVALGSLAGKAQFEGAARFGEAASLVPFSEVRRGRSERPSSEPAPAIAATPGSRKRSTGGSK
jgi:hypothetical protein